MIVPITVIKGKNQLNIRFWPAHSALVNRVGHGNNGKGPRYIIKMLFKSVYRDNGMIGTDIGVGENPVIDQNKNLMASIQIEVFGMVNFFNPTLCPTFE